MNFFESEIVPELFPDKNQKINIKIYGSVQECFEAYLGTRFVFDGKLIKTGIDADGMAAQAGLGYDFAASTLSTSGSSATVSCTKNAFSDVRVGALIVANATTRRVTAVAVDGSSCTVETAVDWSAGYTFTYQNPPMVLQSNGTTRFVVNSNGLMSTYGISTYADNAAALAGGLKTGDIYRTATGILMVVYTP